MTLNQCFTLELRETDTVFVSLGLPHASDCIGAGAPEALDKLRVLLEMSFPRRPVKSDRNPHRGEFPQLNTASRFVRKRTVRLGLN